MNITLRKANAIQNSIQEAIKSIKIETSISINEFQDPATELQKANAQLFENDARRQKLLLALYNIRGLVGQANAASGIDVNLAKAAFVDKRIGQLEVIASEDVMTDLAVITGKLKKLSEDKGERRIYGYNEHVTTTVLSKDQINQAKAEIKNLKKQKQQLNDEILELNIKTEIPLSEDVVNTLTVEGLL
jgi:hypothetical protein